jgi:CRP-like cAMP-binding protein
MASDADTAPPHFSINLANLKLVGMEDPLSAQAPELYDGHGLSAEDRLFFSLSQNSALESGAFEPGDRIAMRGDPVQLAHVVISGEMTASSRQGKFTLGPGSVIGLAEGMAYQPHTFTVLATSAVRTRVIPMDKARQELLAINAGLRGICRTAIVRILDLPEAPENLK